MTKKPSGEKRGGRPPLVRDSAGTRHPFLRGMVTHDLVERGLPFDDAYATAQALRDRTLGRDEITTAELRQLIDEELEGLLGAEGVAALRAGDRPAAELVVSYPHQRPLPFSRGLLAQSLLAVGLDLDRAYRLVVELQKELREDGVERLDARELARRVADLVERWEGKGVAGRYRLMRRIRRLPRPLVIYLGGASGVGKSTLSLSLAPLLRVYRINATDTIRQVMRMVFSPAILPALHRSSFELGGRHQPAGEAGRSAPTGDEARRELVAAFEAQATRVCVGVRAVVERSVAEDISILVEGVHLLPPLAPFDGLDGTAYQLMVMLTTLDEEVHRGRLLARSRRGSRPAERYLDNFDNIRTLQEFLMQRAEELDVPLLDTSDSEAASARALNLVSRLLQQRLPWLVEAAGRAEAKVTPSLMLLIDGLGDQPVQALGGRTPLAAAATPTLDRLAREGVVGLAEPAGEGVVPDTASGNLAALGQSPRAMQRGPIEAAGTGFVLEPQDIAIRGNFATLDAEGRVEDRRAGRLRDGAEELAAAIDRLPLGPEHPGVEVRVRAATEHRLAVVLRGESLSSAIRGSDPGDAAPLAMPLVPQALDPEDEAAVRTAAVLARFEAEAHRVLDKHPLNARRRKAQQPPANAILTRGAGRPHRLAPLEAGGVPLRLACISGDRTLLGLAYLLGADCFTSDSMTANLDTDLREKFAVAATALRDHDLVVLHIKGADIASHDRRADLKVQFLESIDQELDRFLARAPAEMRVAVASDHSTLSELGQHSADPVPTLIWGSGVAADPVVAFDEGSVVGGALGRFALQLLIDKLFSPLPVPELVAAPAEEPD